MREYQKSVADEGRFIIAYRHPGDSDPHLVFQVLTNLLRGEAPATAADGRPGAWYPAGTEVQLWASPLVLWALRNAGIVPVRHGAIDREVLDYLVKGVAERHRPMAIAPEGMTTLHCNTLPELDPGTSRIALLAAERLSTSDKPMSINILPLSIDYSYERTTSPARLARFIDKLEKRIGLDGSGSRSAGTAAGSAKASESQTGPADRTNEGLKKRLLEVWARLIDIMESLYARSWNIRPAPAGSSLRERTLELLDASIGKLEAFYGVVPAQSLKTRILNIRAESLRRVFHSREELSAFSALEHGAAQRGSAEAYFIDQIYSISSVAFYLDPAYLDGQPHFNRLVEIALNLHELANRLEGKGQRYRSRYFRKDALIVVGEPIPVARQGGEGRKETAARIQKELEEGLRSLIRH